MKVAELRDTAEMVLAVERTEYKHPTGHPLMRIDAAVMVALADVADAARGMSEGMMDRCPDKDALDETIRSDHRDKTCRACRLLASLARLQKEEFDER